MGGGDQSSRRRQTVPPSPGAPTDESSAVAASPTPRHDSSAVELKNNAARPEFCEINRAHDLWRRAGSVATGGCDRRPGRAVTDCRASLGPNENGVDHKLGRQAWVLAWSRSARLVRSTLPARPPGHSSRITSCLNEIAPADQASPPSGQSPSLCSVAARCRAALLRCPGVGAFPRAGC